MKEHKIMKWWMRIFISLFDTTIMNSYIIYKGKTNSSDTQSEFREILIKSILEEHIKTKYQAVPKNISNEVCIYRWKLTVLNLPKVLH